MTSTAKAHEPTMEEILASIRRIIADDDPASAQPPSQSQAKPASAAAAAKPRPVEAPKAEPEADSAGLNQDDIDAMLASFDAPEPKPAPAKDGASDDDELAAAWADAAGLDEDAGTQGTDSDAAEVEDDVLELTEAAKIAQPPAYDLDDVAFAPEPAARPAAAVPPPLTSAARAAQAETPRAAATPAGLSDTLIARETGEAVSAAFGSLSNTILSQNARTLDELVQEMLRPMLKDWLDDNLPQIVERLVRSEIERVSRGRR